MAELADALDLGSSGQPRAGSIPVIRISLIKHIGFILCALLISADQIKPVRFAAGSACDKNIR